MNNTSSRITAIFIALLLVPGTIATAAYATEKSTTATAANADLSKEDIVSLISLLKALGFIKPEKEALVDSLLASWGIETASTQVTPEERLAQCLSSAGVKLYAAYWCPHCKQQKDMFGSGATYLPYVECSTPDGRDQMAVCATAQIKAYPTWVFPGGNRLEGSVSLETLATYGNCSYVATE